jgi:hypothetical protein
MRDDVKNVIAERPKSNRTWQSNTPRKKAVKLDGDGEQFDEGSNFLQQKRQKIRSARFRVLERFLMNRVGCSWDKVFAEVCRSADSRSFQGAEIRDVLKSFVATGCWVEGKTVMGRDSHGCAQAVHGFYVHPKTGILRVTAE